MQFYVWHPIGSGRIFSLLKFNQPLFKRGLLRKFQSKIYNRCSHCDSITTDHEVEQTDLILPMYDCIANGDQLQKVLDKYCILTEWKKWKCDSCDSTTVHTSKVVFQNLLLVVCLSRATFDEGLKTGCRTEPEPEP